MRTATATWTFRAIGLVGTLIFIGISLMAQPGSTYRFSFIFLSLLLWLVYALRRGLSLHPFHFALFLLALLLHNLGAFGYYRREIFGLEFDGYVHTWFGFVIGLMLYRWFTKHLVLSPWGYRIAVIAFVLGLGALHELMEYSTNLILGPEKGMLKPEITGPFDTHEDLANNLFGGLAALLCYALFRTAPVEPDARKH